MELPSSSSWPKRLRQERIGRNWRQQDLADRLETTVVTIKRWERGTQHPSAYFRVKLCALFGKSAEELGLVEQVTELAPVSATAPAQEKGTPVSMISADAASLSAPHPVIEPIQAPASSLRSATLPPAGVPARPTWRRSVVLVGVLPLLGLLLLAAIVWDLPGFANALRATPVPTQVVSQKPSVLVTPTSLPTPTTTPTPVPTATSIPISRAMPMPAPTPTAVPTPTPLPIPPTTVELRLSAPGIASTNKSVITVPSGTIVTLTVVPDHSLLPFQTATMGIYATDPYGFSELQDCTYPNTATCSYVVAFSSSEHTDYTKGQHTFRAFLGNIGGAILMNSNGITIIWS